MNIDADAIALFDSNGKVFTSWSGSVDTGSIPIGSEIWSNPYFDQIPDVPRIGGGRRTFKNNSSVVSVYQIRGFPYYTAVLYTKDNILHKWRQQTKSDIIILTGALIVAFCTLILAFRQHQKRRTAEVILHDYQTSLEETVSKRTRQLDASNRTLLKKNEDLQNALDEIKILKGIIPICAHCKNVRDDKGFWQQVESYIDTHSDASFSHGICPDCAEKYYPEFNLYENDEPKT